MLNKLIPFIKLLLIISVVSCFTSTGMSAIIVADGKVNSVIVVGLRIPDSVRLAANELQNYIWQVTDVKVPIQTAPVKEDGVVNIFVGQSHYINELGVTTDTLKSDCFRIVAKDNWIIIAGSDYDGPVRHGTVNPWLYHETYNPKWKIGAFGETGTLYAVYEFLYQNCGIRWYMPGPLGTVVPKMGKLEVDSFDITGEPDFEYRYPWFCNFSEADDESIWYRRVGFGAAAPVQIQHSFVEMLKYKDTHPEYFALIDGQRDFSNLSTALPHGNLCLSNPGLVEQWVEDICKYFDANPLQKIYPIVPNDGMSRICECNDCQSQIDTRVDKHGQFSNYVWTFVDKIARGVAMRHPDKYIGGLSYNFYAIAPNCIEKFSPNVIVMICKMRATYYNPEDWKNKIQFIKEWKKKTDLIYVWEYYLHSWLPWRGLPIIFPHIISGDLAALKGISMGEMIQAESWEDGAIPTNRMDFPGMQHLNLYVTARVYWDTTVDVDALLGEYFKLFYGPAEQEMKAFWQTAESYWMDQDRSEPRIAFGGVEPVKTFSPDRVNTLMFLLDSARAKTKTDSVYRERVELISQEFESAVKRLKS